MIEQKENAGYVVSATGKTKNGGKYSVEIIAHYRQIAIQALALIAKYTKAGDTARVRKHCQVYNAIMGEIRRNG